ncbi:MAG: argininosuccinate lyase [Spirochaetia bacterium]|nr:argininosuccinate lyase [Spirochaetia bacterium]
MSENKKNLWGGRFESKISKISQEISESISFDKALYKYDIEASLAHAQMLSKQKIITKEQFEKIKAGLLQIQKEIEENKMEFSFELEDIHMHIENRLTEIIGEEGKRLHTGRSRNDQVAVDTHLFLKDNILKQKKLLINLLKTFYEKAKEHKNDIWAGYTHTQIAQPVLLGHYLMAYFWKFQRDLLLLEFAFKEADVSPLGGAALAGANYDIDREFTAKKLGFSSVYENSMDAVSTRDYQLSYHFFAVRLFIHISRICEELIWYNSAEFQYVTMTDKVTTGSSIMPQKKNPDIAEILRGKTGRVAGSLNALLMNLKSLPLTYNRDLQEDKIYLFDTVKQISLGLEGLIEILKNTVFHPQKVEQNLEKGFAQATDIADYLVTTYNLPFREAHELTGKLVKYCESKKITLSQIKETDLTAVWGEKYTLSLKILNLKECINNKQGTGSTSEKEFINQLKKAEKVLSGLGD